VGRENEELSLLEISLGTDMKTYHREEKYKLALSNFDKAYSLASDQNKPEINFLRSLTAFRIPGAESTIKK